MEWKTFTINVVERYKKSFFFITQQKSKEGEEYRKNTIQLNK